MQKDDNANLPTLISPAGVPELYLPDSVAAHGAAGRFAWEEFFAGHICNPHTRKAYLHAVRRFLHWTESQGVELQAITPGMIGRYLDLHPGCPPTKKLHMSAIRGLFDVLVQRHVVVLNPALSVKTERYSVTEGRTPAITVEQARLLHNSIRFKCPIDFRDRAVIGMLIYTTVRVGAIAKLRVSDLADEGSHISIRFREKGGKQRIIPCRISLQEDLDYYLRAAEIPTAEKDSPVFRSGAGRTGQLSNRPMSAIDICRMIKRRLKQADLPAHLSPHSFRSCGATDLLSQGVPLDDVQYLLGHADARVTKLYDRRQREVTRNIVERISV